MSNTFFEWDSAKYSVFVSAMDSEHQELIRLMNVLYQKNAQKADKDTLVKHLVDLLDYSKKHFKDEEAFFFNLPNYPLAQAHKKIHDDLIAKLNDHLTQFKAQPGGQLPADFFMFLKIWLTAHIAGIDRKYGELAQHHSKKSA